MTRSLSQAQACRRPARRPPRLSLYSPAARSGRARRGPVTAAARAVSATVTLLGAPASRNPRLTRTLCESATGRGAGGRARGGRESQAPSQSITVNFNSESVEVSGLEEDRLVDGAGLAKNNSVT
jgi:hypothetical protein